MLIIGLLEKYCVYNIRSCHKNRSTIAIIWDSIFNWISRQYIFDLFSREMFSPCKGPTRMLLMKLRRPLTSETTVRKPSGAAYYEINFTPPGLVSTYAEIASSRKKVHESAGSWFYSLDSWLVYRSLFNNIRYCDIFSCLRCNTLIYNSSTSKILYTSMIIPSILLFRTCNNKILNNVKY